MPSYALYRKEIISIRYKEKFNIHYYSDGYSIDMHTVVSTCRPQQCGGVHQLYTYDQSLQKHLEVHIHPIIYTHVHTILDGNNIQ